MKKTIMVVEDESIAALELCETLRNMGYFVPEPVGSADKVIGAVIKEQPDAIFMDINLSNFIDGIDVAQRIKLLKDIPLIYLTAYNNDETMRRAERTKPAAFLSKPSSTELIGRTLEQIFS